MLTILTFTGLAFAAGVCLMWREIRRAPEGSQDEAGFHLHVRMPAKENLRGRRPVDHARAA